MKANLKVVHVLQHSLPSLAGYTIRADGILRSQREMDIDALALTGALENGSQLHEETINGVRYLRTPPVDLPRSPLREWALYRALKKRLQHVIEREEPDIIHAHSPAYNGLAAVRAARQAKIACVYEMRALWEDAAADRGKMRTGSLLYRAARSFENRVQLRANAVVTISQGLRDEVIRQGLPPGKVFVIPNGVSPERFLPGPRDFRLAASLGWSDHLVFGFIGSLFNYEGVEDLLEAAPGVLARFPKARFLIVGGGEREQQVKEKAARWTNGEVVWRPRVAHDTVRGFYSLVDCFVYPRRSIRLTELVTPLKPLEAMAMEKCVVASDVGGHREMIANERTGLLYRPGDTAALVDCLSRLAADPELRRRLGDEGRQFVLAERTWKSVSAGYAAVYQHALSGSRRRPASPAEQKA